ncbi:hypothetical protein BH23BAC1_BH23BAC1_10670 [soil metagenome]
MLLTFLRVFAKFAPEFKQKNIESKRFSQAL